jgi:hypothetical protein
LKVFDRFFSGFSEKKIVFMVFFVNYKWNFCDNII